jgi:acyl-CoA thioesterase-1
VLLSAVRLPPNYGPVYIEQFASLYQRLSERYGIPLVPRMLNQVAENRELMQEDGIHPKAAAQPQIMQNVWVGLEQMLEKQ